MGNCIISRAVQPVEVDQTYSDISTNAQSGVAVKQAIDALDVTTSGMGAGKTLSALTQTDGKISATYQDISITTSQVSDFPTIPTVSDTYSGTSSNAMSGKAVKQAIDALDVTTSGMGAGKTLKTLTETDGKIAATFQDISITKSQVSDFSHAHGKITNAGAISTNATIASGDRLLICDADDSDLIKRTSITFGTSTTTFLSNKGTWETPAGGFHGINTDSQLASYTSAFTYTAKQDAYAIGTLQKGSDEMVVTLNGKTINQSTYGVASANTYTFITVPLKNGDILKVTNTVCNVKVYKIK